MEDRDQGAEFCSQWAILPAPVRYDAALPPNAKLIFAEIAAKTNVLGYCWASNRYFAGLYGLSPERVQKLIAALERRGYLRIEVDNESPKSEARRKIYLTAAALCLAPPNPEKNDADPRQKRRGTPDKNDGGQQYKENKKENTRSLSQESEKPAYLSLEIYRAICQWCGEDGELLLAWMQFADMRQKTRHPIATVATVERACRTIDRCAQEHAGGSRAYKLGMLHKATDCAWRSFYPLKPDDEGYQEPRTQETERRPALWT